MKLELNAFSDFLQVPAMFEVVETSELAFEKLYTTWPYLSARTNSVLILCGGGGSTISIAAEYARFFRDKVDANTQIYKISEASVGESRTIDSFCAKGSISLLVAIGGGKVIDTAKMVAKQRNLALVCIPSALSSDGITSPVSVLRDDEGAVRSFASGIPACVLVDLSITTRAPAELTLSGVGDILSNVSALLDVDDYEAAGHGQVNGFAKLLSHSACQMILPLTREDMSLPEGHEAIARALILSGLSMAFSGNSLPCSGGEHLISHAIDHLNVGTGTHGLQVAVATLYCLSLRGVLGRHGATSDVRGAMLELGLPARPEEIGIERSSFLKAVRAAPGMRAGRYTLLHSNIDDHSLQAAYDQAFTGRAS